MKQNLTKQQVQEVIAPYFVTIVPGDYELAFPEQPETNHVDESFYRICIVLNEGSSVAIKPGKTPFWLQIHTDNIIDITVSKSEVKEMQTAGESPAR
jgi:hypothetical protein